MITKEVLPVDVGEVAAADLEAVVCEVDLEEAVEVDSEEVKYKFIQYLDCLDAFTKKLSNQIQKSCNWHLLFTCFCLCNEFNHLCRAGCKSNSQTEFHFRYHSVVVYKYIIF